jgi:hypothetical protein
MARVLRTAVLTIASITAWVALDAFPAAAQFINPFEAIFGPAPRPPSSVPGGRQQTPAPQPQYLDDPDPRYPVQQPRHQSEPAVQSQPLPPPAGGTAAAVDPTRGGGGQPMPAGLSPGERQPPGTPQPANTSPQPGEEVVAEPPSQKITNKAALFSGLDKITGRIITFDAAIGETVQFGALQVTPRVCYTRPPTETPNTDGFIEVDEVTLQGEVKRIFTGWMFASSPGLHAVEHPIYDVWLTDCKNPVVAAAAPAEPVAMPAEQPAKPSAPRRPAQQGAPQSRSPGR